MSTAVAAQQGLEADTSQLAVPKFDSLLASNSWGLAKPVSGWLAQLKPDPLGSGRMRRLQPQELPLARWLLNSAGRPEQAEDLWVAPMQDGGMGSLRIGVSDGSRTLGICVSQCVFDDRDGTLVSATLNLDKNGAVFELDIWRVDFQPLQQWPSSERIRPGSAAA